MNVRGAQEFSGIFFNRKETCNVDLFQLEMKYIFFVLNYVS